MSTPAQYAPDDQRYDDRMPYRRSGRSGLLLPAISLGCWHNFGDGQPLETRNRMTLCRCGASKHKPFCDGSHNEVKFVASGEPATGKADMLAVRDGPLAIDPEINGPLQVRGNMEIISGTGRVVARMESARLCRCGGSSNKPFCDNSHRRIGFRE